MNHKTRAQTWMHQNLVKASGQREATLEQAFADAEAATLQRIARWLGGLETVLQKERLRTDDPEMHARRGIYDGIASEVLDGTWKRGTE